MHSFIKQVQCYLEWSIISMAPICYQFSQQTFNSQLSNIAIVVNVDGININYMSWPQGFKF